MSCFITSLGLNRLDLVYQDLATFSYSNEVNSLIYNFSNLEIRVDNVESSLSNYETIISHNADVANLNSAISNLSYSLSNVSNSNYELVVDHNADVSNLNSAISNLSISSSNYETIINHNADVANLNAGISNISLATSNYETITNHNADVVNLNSAISNLSVASSNYITANQSVELKNKTIDFNSNVILNYPTGTGTGGSNITSVLNISNPYKFKAYLNSNQTIIGTSSNLVACSVIEYDLNNNFNTQDFFYTITKTGYYQIDWAITLDPTNIKNGDEFFASIILNDTTNILSFENTAPRAGYQIILNTANTELFYIGDTLKLYISTTNTYNNIIIKPGIDNTHFNIHLLSVDTPLEQAKLYTVVNSSNQITGHIPYWDGYSNQLNVNGYNYTGDIANLNVGISNVNNSLVNYETIINHNADVANLNAGISNVNNNLVNYETITNHNADVANLNAGISNVNNSLVNYETITNHNADVVNLNSAISNLSVASSNYITALQTVELKNKTIDFNSNVILNLPGGSGTSNYYTSNNYYTTSNLVNDQPIGTIVDYTGSVAPSNWLLCYGQAISRTTYSELYSVIGTTYGSGDGSTTFNVPDYRGRVSAGKDNMGGSSANNITDSYGSNLGGTGGSSSIYGSNAVSGSGAFITTTGTGYSLSNNNNIQPTIIVNKIIKYTTSANPYSAVNIQNIYNPYYGRTFLTAGLSNLTDNVWTDLPITGIAYGNSMSSFNSNNYTFTCLITGVYRFSLIAEFSGGIAGDTVGIRILKNGTSGELTLERAVIRTGVNVDLTTCNIITLNVGDTVKMQARAIGSSVIDVIGASYAGGGEDYTGFSWLLEMSSTINTNTTMYATMNSNINQTRSNIPLFGGSSYELIDSGINLNNYAVSNLKSATTSINISSATAPNAGQALVATSASNATWQTVSSFTQTATKTANYTAVNGDEVLCDTNAASGDITITLPASPSAGNSVRIILITQHATRKVLIGRNGSSIDGRTASEGELYYTLWKNGDTVTFKYVGGSSGWIATDRNIVNRFMGRRYRATNQSMAGTWDKVLIDTTDYDYNNDFSNYKYTVPITGIYFIQLRVLTTSGFPDQQALVIGLYKNGSSIIENYYKSSGIYYFGPDLTTYVPLNAGDYIEFYIYSGSTWTLYGSSVYNNMIVNLISRT